MTHFYFKPVLFVLFMTVATGWKLSAQSLNQPQQMQLAAQWRYDRLKDEQGNYYPAYVGNAQNQSNIAAISRSSGLGLQWQELGPDNVGGYITTFIIDARDTTNNTIYAGTFAGGIWKSTNGGNSWSVLDKWNKWLAIGCMVQAPAPDYTIYVGTGLGEVDPSGSSFGRGSYGDGVFKLNHLDSAIQLTPTIFTNNLYDPPATPPWSSVNAMAINPVNSQQIIACTTVGAYETLDGGNTWTKISFSGQLATYGNLPANDVQWSADGRNIFLDIGYNTSTTAILYSNNSGNTWAAQNSGTNNGYPIGSIGRIALAVAPSNPKIVYALMTNTSYCGKGLYKSSNAGNTWQTIAIADSIGNLFGQYGCQGWYDIAIAVSPGDTNKVYMGGVYVATASIHNGVNIASEVTNTSSPFYVAVDIKHFTIAANNPDLMYIATDGGVFKSVDAASAFPTPTYAAKNNGLSILQNYGIGAGLDGDVIGGAQEGTYYINYSANDPKAGIELFSPAGILNGVSVLDSNIWFGGSYFGGALRSIDHCNGFTGFYDLKVDPQSQGGLSVCGGMSINDDAPFITPAYLGETKNAIGGLDSLLFVAGQNYAAGQVIRVSSVTGNYSINYTLSENLTSGDTLMVYDPIRSRYFISSNCGVFVTSEPLNRNGIPKWFKLYPAISGNVDSYVTSADGNMLCCGTNSGNVYCFKNLNAHADTAKYPLGISFGLLYSYASSDVSSTAVASGRAIEGIDVDPNDNNHIVAVVAGFSTNVNQPHVYESTDGGVTWTGLLAGLPNMPVYSVVVHDSHTFIIGTEFGIWTWDGTSWHEDNGNFVRMPVYRLIEKPMYTDGCKVLYMGSCGRGMWRTTTLTASGCQTEIPTAVKNVSQPAAALLKIWPNPIQDRFKVDVTLDKPGAVVIRIVDITGKVYSEKQYQQMPEGENVFDLNASGWSSGTYILNVHTGDGASMNKLFVVE